MEPSRPSIFISHEGGENHWRLMEKLAAIFELYINPNPDNVFTFSSAKVPDCIDSHEQVDVAYSYLPDPSRLFSFIEVRDRNTNIGRGYIQEVIGKRKSIGVNDCCIVSTKGFSPDAQKLAQHEKIRIRIIDAKTDEKSDFFKLDQFSIKHHAPDIQSCIVDVIDTERQRTGAFTALAGDIFERELLMVTPDGHRIGLPLELLLNRILDYGGWAQLKVAQEKSTVLRLDCKGFGLKLCYTETGTGLPREVDVLTVSYTVRMQISQEKIPRSGLYYYRDALTDEILAEALLFKRDSERTAVCMVRTLTGIHRASAIMFLTEKELSRLATKKALD